MTRTIETGTDDLLAHVDGHVGVIAFNRPERRNALSDPMYAGFGRALPAMATDPEVRVIMITGMGGAFCAGGDVKGMNEAHRSGGRAPRSGWRHRRSHRPASAIAARRLTRAASMSQAGRRRSAGRGGGRRAVDRARRRHPPRC